MKKSLKKAIFFAVANIFLPDFLALKNHLKKWSFFSLIKGRAKKGRKFHLKTLHSLKKTFNYLGFNVIIRLQNRI